MGKENFPLDISDRETLHAIIKKHPELGKTSQKRRIGGKMESCICIYLSSFPSEVRTEIQQGESQSELHKKKSSCSSRDPLSGIFFAGLAMILGSSLEISSWQNVWNLQ